MVAPRGVVVDRSFLTRRDEGSGVPQGSLLEPVLFNIFISDLDVESTLSKFTDDTRLWGEEGMLEGRDRIQLDLDGLQRWVDENRMQFNADRCKVLHLGRRNQQHPYRLGNSLLVNTVAERDLGVIADSRMNTSLQCEEVVSKANRTLSCIYRCITSKSKEMILPLCAALVKPQLESCVQFWALHFKRDVASTERVQKRATRMVKRQQGRPYEDRLKGLILLSLHKRRLRGGLVVVYQLTRRDQQELGEALFPQAPPGITRDNGHRLLERRFRLDIRRHYLQLGLPSSGMGSQERWCSLLPLGS
uniref:Reverse transcriptase domain-containing protein n=1 Tax=Crocodylus porosus TaxID=8502 RepID=A0A7M4FDT0_CROPO